VLKDPLLEKVERASWGIYREGGEREKERERDLERREKGEERCFEGKEGKRGERMGKERRQIRKVVISEDDKMYWAGTRVTVILGKGYAARG
jgi:hypothetical protein